MTIWYLKFDHFVYFGEIIISLFIPQTGSVRICESHEDTK